MANIKNLKPFKVFGPGYFIQEQMDEREWTQEDLAAVLGMSIKSINLLLQNKQSITIDTARLLCEAFGQSPQFWINLDTNYRLHLKEVTEKEKFVNTKSLIYNYMPISEMYKKGWLTKTTDTKYLEEQVETFWHKENIDFIQANQEPLPCFKKSEAHSQFSVYAAKTWFQMAKNSCSYFDVPNYNEEKLKSLLENISEYSYNENGIASFLKELNNVGVRFMLLPHLQKTYLDGAAFLNEQNPVVVYTGRYKRVDNFWFTIAHEIVHILKHIKSSNDVFLDDLTQKDVTIQEKEANEIAQKMLKHGDIINFFNSNLHYITKQQIADCSRELKIHQAVIIGALAFQKTISFSHLHEFNENVLPKIPLNYFVENHLNVNS